MLAPDMPMKINVIHEMHGQQMDLFTVAGAFAGVSPWAAYPEPQEF